MNPDKSNSKNIIVTLQIYNSLPHLKAVNSLYTISCLKVRHKPLPSELGVMAFLNWKFQNVFLVCKCEDTKVGAFSKWNMRKHIPNSLIQSFPYFCHIFLYISGLFLWLWTHAGRYHQDMGAFTCGLSGAARMRLLHLKAELGIKGTEQDSGSNRSHW